MVGFCKFWGTKNRSMLIIMELHGFKPTFSEKFTSNMASKKSDIQHGVSLGIPTCRNLRTHHTAVGMDAFFWWRVWSRWILRHHFGGVFVVISSQGSGSGSGLFRKACTQPAEQRHISKTYTGKKTEMLPSILKKKQLKTQRPFFW